MAEGCLAALALWRRDILSCQPVRVLAVAGGVALAVAGYTAGSPPAGALTPDREDWSEVLSALRLREPHAPGTDPADGATREPALLDAPDREEGDLLPLAASAPSDGAEAQPTPAPGIPRLAARQIPPLPAQPQRDVQPLAPESTTETAESDRLQGLERALRHLADQMSELQRQWQDWRQDNASPPGDHHPGQKWKFLALRRLDGRIYAHLQQLAERHSSQSAPAPGAQGHPEEYLLAEGDHLSGWMVRQVDPRGILVLEELTTGRWLRLMPGQLWQQ